MNDRNPSIGFGDSDRRPETVGFPLEILKRDQNRPHPAPLADTLTRAPSMAPHRLRSIRPRGDLLNIDRALPKNCVLAWRVNMVEFFYELTKFGRHVIKGRAQKWSATGHVMRGERERPYCGA